MNYSTIVVVVNKNNFSSCGCVLRVCVGVGTAHGWFLSEKKKSRKHVYARKKRKMTNYYYLLLSSLV